MFFTILQNIISITKGQKRSETFPLKITFLGLISLVDTKTLVNLRENWESFCNVLLPIFLDTSSNLDGNRGCAWDGFNVVFFFFFFSSFRVHLRFQAISFKWTLDENSTGRLMFDFVTWSCFQKASCYIQNKVNLRSPPKNLKSHISFENFRILRLILQSYYHNLRYSFMRLWLTMSAT